MSPRTRDVSRSFRSPPSRKVRRYRDGIMCFFEETVWACGCWRWGNLGQQCLAERRIGQTCGLKLIWSRKTREQDCQLCLLIARKERRVERMIRDIARWMLEGNRVATIDKTRGDVEELRQSITCLRDRRGPDHLRYLGHRMDVSSAPAMSASLVKGQVLSPSPQRSRDDQHGCHNTTVSGVSSSALLMDTSLSRTKSRIRLLGPPLSRACLPLLDGCVEDTVVKTEGFQ